MKDNEDNIDDLQGLYRSWKVLEFSVEIFKALKSLENDYRYRKVWKNP